MDHGSEIGPTNRMIRGNRVAELIRGSEGVTVVGVDSCVLVKHVDDLADSEVPQQCCWIALVG